MIPSARWGRRRWWRSCTVCCRACTVILAYDWLTQIMLNSDWLTGAAAVRPEDILIPDWHWNKLFHGTYSNWPVGVTSSNHRNLVLSRYLNSLCCMKYCRKLLLITCTWLGKQFMTMLDMFTVLTSVESTLQRRSSTAWNTTIVSRFLMEDMTKNASSDDQVAHTNIEIHKIFSSTYHISIHGSEQNITRSVMKLVYFFSFLNYCWSSFHGPSANIHPCIVKD